MMNQSSQAEMFRNMIQAIAQETREQGGAERVTSATIQLSSRGDIKVAVRLTRTLWVPSQYPGEETIR